MFLLKALYYNAFLSFYFYGKICIFIQKTAVSIFDKVCCFSRRRFFDNSCRNHGSLSVDGRETPDAFFGADIYFVFNPRNNGLLSSFNLPPNVFSDVSAADCPDDFAADGSDCRQNRPTADTVCSGRRHRIILIYATPRYESQTNAQYHQPVLIFVDLKCD